MSTPNDNARGLLQKAENDLIAAQATLATERASDTVCFHAQQAVEKSLKATLALHDIEYPWTHNLGELLKLAQPLVPALASYAERIIMLTPYAVGSRYDDNFNPPLDETRAALQLAMTVHQLLKDYINTPSE